MGMLRRVWVVVGLVVLVGASACGPPPPPTTDVNHLTVWEADVAYADTNPEIVGWVGYGSLLYNKGLGGCNVVEGGAGWSESFTRIDSATVRVRLTLGWIEGDNGVDGYGCGVNDPLNVGLKDGNGNEVTFALIPLVSHS